MKIEGKMATVTSVPASGLKPCRDTTTVSAIKQQPGVLTSEKELALITSSHEWSHQLSMKWWWKKQDRCKYGGGGWCTAIFRIRGVPHRRAWYIFQLKKQPRAMAAMSPLGAAPASSKRELIKCSLKRVDSGKRKKGTKKNSGFMHLQFTVLAPRKVIYYQQNPWQPWSENALLAPFRLHPDICPSLALPLPCNIFLLSCVPGGGVPLEL